MSEIRLNVIDTTHSIHGTVHGSIGDAVIASLSAEPETIDELDKALDRFNKRLDEQSHFELFVDSEDTEPWDAGVVIVDLATRLVAVDSTYSAPGAQGEINYHDGTCATDLLLPYVLPADWLFVSSIEEYEWLRDERLIERRAVPKRDIRQVLYGLPLIDFITLELLAESERTPEPSGRESNSLIDSPGQPDVETNVQHLSPADGESQCEIVEADELYQFDDPVVQALHIRWLMTPRADLENRTPREVILEKQSFLALDLWSREMQWSFLREGPPPLSRESHAYRFAGFGPHEFVIYYDLVRYLLIECWERVQRGRSNAARDHAPQPTARMDSLTAGAATAPVRDSAPENDQEALRQWLEDIKESWLNGPNEEFEGRAPIALIESERRRIPLVLSAKQMIVDEDCELCRMLADDTHDFGPGFWHLDGCNMDPGFEFSHYQTREEWDAEEARMREIDLEFEQRLKAEQSGTGTERSGIDDEMRDDMHDF